MCKIIYQLNLVKGQYSYSKENYAKNVLIFHDLWVMNRKLTCNNYFIIREIRFSSEHTKSPNTNVLARPDVIFWAVGYHPSPESQLAFHIYYVKYDNTVTCKMIS